MLATAKHFVGDGGTTYGSRDYRRYKIDQGITQVTRAHLQHDRPAAVRHGGEAGRRLGHAVLLVAGLHDDPNDKTTKMHARGDLITGWLKQQEGFDGFVISDWPAIDQIGPTTSRT